jgi:glycosyltransferase involved in cell wall biosynthesis
MSMKRLALVTDAWRPQTNGVVNTLVRLVKHLEARGTEVLVISPDAHRTMPLPSYPEIRVALDPWKAIKRIRAFAPDAVHVATEGPLGFWTIGWLRYRGLRFTTSFHTRYAEYLSARLPVPLEWGYRLVRWFHARAQHTLVSSMSLLRELEGKRVGHHLVHWPRGVDSVVFNPQYRRDEVYDLPRPIWLYVGRIAVEKSLEDFLSLPLPGSKVVVGDGPSREGLQRRFPDVVWRGYRYGDDLSAHFASADCFVFPSRTETFGNVLLEAMASGLPVASVPAPGPVDIVQDGINGAIDDNLLDACMRAMPCSREKTRASIEGRTLQAGHEVFRAHLVPVQPQTPYLIPPRTGVLTRRPSALPPRAPAIPQPAAG